jgi:hypothetical protein
MVRGSVNAANFRSKRTGAARERACTLVARPHLMNGAWEINFEVPCVLDPHSNWPGAFQPEASRHQRSASTVLTVQLLNCVPLWRKLWPGPEGGVTQLALVPPSRKLEHLLTAIPGCSISCCHDVGHIT